MKPVSAESADLPIAQALRLLRESLEITQTEAGRRGDPDHRTISHWETGRKMPSLRLLMLYLGALDRDLHDLQIVFDQIKGPGRLSKRLRTMEQRLGALERWRLEMTAAAVDTGRNESCQSEPSKEILTAS